MILTFACNGTNNEDNSLSTQKSKSNLINFNYMGYSDTICATLYGKILFENEIGDTIPLEEVVIVGLDSDEKLLSDSLGEFSSCNDAGNYTIEFSKKGFQTLILENYVAKSDQVSNTIILMVRGTGENTEKIMEDEEK